MQEETSVQSSVGGFKESEMSEENNTGRKSSTLEWPRLATFLGRGCLNTLDKGSSLSGNISKLPGDLWEI